MTILTYPHDVIALREKSIPVDEITDELVSNAQEMMKLMRDEGGIGLAAPQVGISKRFFVMDTTESDPAFGFKGILFNPQIIAWSTKKSVFIEGCLSLPGVRQPTCRSSNVRVKYTDEFRKEHLAIFWGISAICAQHEIDHLNGTLLVDYNQEKKK